MNKSLFTAEQIQDLKREFVEFKLNEMSHEDMYAWIRDVLSLIHISEPTRPY